MCKQRSAALTLTLSQRERGFRTPLTTHHSPLTHKGFTLVEVLMATALTLLIMLATVTLFGTVTEGISGSRAIIETMDRLRGTEERLVRDLRGITAPMLPPLRPEWGLGYFEYIEGTDLTQPRNPPPVVVRRMAATAIDDSGNPDTTVGDTDDILMFTTRSSGEAFIGRFGTGVQQSQIAEVTWFLRGTTLYRRVLLVAPNVAVPTTAHGPGFYNFFDVSAREVGGAFDPAAGVPAMPGGRIVFNSLGDLTKRESRYAHQPWSYPHGINWTFNDGGTVRQGGFGQLGLPTLEESSDTFWPFPLQDRVGPPASALPTSSTSLAGSSSMPVRNILGTLIRPAILGSSANGNNERLILAPNQSPPALPTGTVDLWTNPHPWAEVNSVTGTLIRVPASGGNPAIFYGGPRVGEDVILTNVISFDVKAWDPGCPVYQDSSGNLLVPGDNNYGATGTTAVGYGAHVDLGYWRAMGGTSAPLGLGGVAAPSLFWDNSTNNIYNPLQTGATAYLRPLARVYDVWSTHYEADGIDQNGNGATDEGTNGLDDNGVGGVDDPTEMEAPPPYPVPLRGVQIKIRVFEPDSRQIREVTVVHDFLPE